MKQVLQNLRSGETAVVEVPTPGIGRGSVLIQTRASLISAGTERMLVEFSKASLIGKAKAQPEKVKQVLDKIKTDGLMPTLEAVFNKLDEPLPLGYCNVGTVLEVGADVVGLAPGDRVASNGPHGQIVAVPRLLCAKVPDEVDDEQAAFTVLSSIGLQGVRLLQPTLGETVAVIGMGLIGLVTVQLLRAHGCRVLASDVNAERLALAESFGAEVVNAGAGGDPVAAGLAATEGRGVDAVLITAAAKTDQIIHQAAQMSRKRGRIVLVGVVGLNIQRSDFYEKELSFQVSCSYGPGRYDEVYEQAGQDYPLPYVRWTEQRNFEAILDLMRSGQLNVSRLITHRYPIEQAAEAYRNVSDNRSALGVILQYPDTPARQRCVQLAAPSSKSADRAVVGVVGAGNFTKMTLLPALSKTSARIKYIAGRSHPGAVQHLAAKFAIENASTDLRQLLDDPQVNAILIATGNDSHAALAGQSLAAGKHTFVEKPMAMNVAELNKLARAATVPGSPTLMVGFNRRFSPHSVRIKQLLAARSEPLAMNMTVNAGYIPPEHWVHDPVRGGGRIIAEGCHFIDLMVFLAGSKVASVSAHCMGRGVAVTEDKMSITLSFEDGSVGTVNYFSNGSKGYPKEMLEVFSEKRVLRLDNFRSTVGYDFKGFRKLRTRRQDKGHAAQFAAFTELVVRGGEPLIPLDELVNVTLASFAAMSAAREQRTVRLDDEYTAAMAEPVS